MPSKLSLVNVCAAQSPAPYLYSSYVLKAFLDKTLEDVGVEVFNFAADVDPREAAGQIAAREPEWVGFSCYIWNITRNLEILRELRTMSNAMAIFGGPEISVGTAQELLGPTGPDFCVIGEGERRLAGLLRSLMNNSGSRPLIGDGIAYLSDGEFVCHGDAERVLKLDEIPSPYLSGAIPLEVYQRGHAFLETQRGCRHRCRYCVYHKNLRSISYYSLERVYEELDHLIIDGRVMALRVLDPILTSDLERAKCIVRHLAGMRGRGVRRLPWIYWEFTPTSVDEEFLALLAELKSQPEIHNTEVAPALDRPQFYSDMVRGYSAVNCVGIQSFCPDALHAVRRMPACREEVGRFMDAARRFNIVLKIDIILGLPCETFQSYFEGLEFLVPKIAGTDHVLNIHRLQILPGSDLEVVCGEHGVEYSANAPHLVSATSTMSAEEMAHASRLTALLFRVINSPLRVDLFAALEDRGGDLLAFLEGLYGTICESEVFRDTALCCERCVDDDYWNERVFAEIPTEWLRSYFASCGAAK